MARRRFIDRGQVRGTFTAGSLLNLFAIPFITVGSVMIGFYYTTGDTLRRHDEAIAAIQKDSKVVTDEDRKTRDNDRQVFLANAVKTADVLAKLDTRLAVNETKQEVANQTLNKIVDELSRITTVAPRR